MGSAGSRCVKYWLFTQVALTFDLDRVKGW